jgi:hypothetical protein
MDSKVVETLLEKAASATGAPEAVNFAQAAWAAASV